MTTSRDSPAYAFAVTMVLGLVMAAAIFLLAEPELAWLGFAMAGIYRGSDGMGRGCWARVRSRAAR